MRKTTLALAAVTAFSAALTTGSHASAAEPVSVRCLGTNVVKYHPGVTYEERSLQISGEDNATACLDLANPTQPLSFRAPFSGKFTTSCASVLTGGTGTQTLIWNTGETSQWNWTMRASTNINGQLISAADGPIVGGKYAGTTLQQLVTVITFDQGACFSESGLTETGGPSNWTISS